MSADPAKHTDKSRAFFAQQVGLKAARKLKVQRVGDQSVWFGLGMTGLVGWSVATPTILGALLGLWLDRHHPQTHSWTLALLVAGLMVGCANAWHWVSQQAKAMQEDPEDKDV